MELPTNRVNFDAFGRELCFKGGMCWLTTAGALLGAKVRRHDWASTVTVRDFQEHAGVAGFVELAPAREVLSS